jgi:hypothetical protein
MRKFFFFFLVILIYPNNIAIGQQRDFQCWPSVKLNLEIVNDLNFHLEEELRFHENSSQIKRQLNDIGISYRLNKYIKAGIFYRLEADWKNADEYSWRNGLYSDISLRYGIQRFIFSYRMRLQSSKIELSGKETELFDGFRHRHKFSADYDVKGIPVVPFVEAELFAEYSGPEKSTFRGYRAWIGLDYILNKRHTFTLKYGVDREVNTADPLTAYIIALGYSIDLKLRSVK